MDKKLQELSEKLAIIIDQLDDAIDMEDWGLCLGKSQDLEELHTELAQLAAQN